MIRKLVPVLLSRSSLLLALALLPAVSFGQSLTTTFAGGDEHDGCMFDIEASTTVTITSFDVHFKKGTFNCAVYTVPGGYAGHEQIPGDWTQVGTASHTGGVQGTAQPLALPINVTINAGQKAGFYITITNYNDPNIRYTLGTGTTYSNADIKITDGVGCVWPFLGNFTPRMPNVTAYYYTGAPACNVSTYCAGQMNSGSCMPAILGQGTPSPTVTTAFTLSATNMLPGKFGRFLYSKTGQASVPFQGGTLCALLPLRFTPMMKSSSAAGCGGVMSFDFNTWIKSGKDAALVPGTTVYGQFYSRDPQSSGTTNLTNAIQFSICP